MKYFFFFLLGMSIVSCVDNSHAMTIEQRAVTYKDGLDLSVRDEIKAYVCSKIDCPKHITIDEVKLHGAQLAAVHVSLRYSFE